MGDKPFKQKCLEKMQEIRDSGRTLFYVSHAAGSVRKMCDRVIVLEKGSSASTAPVDAGINLKYDADVRRGERGRRAGADILGSERSSERAESTELHPGRRHI